MLQDKDPTQIGPSLSESGSIQKVEQELRATIDGYKARIKHLEETLDSQRESENAKDIEIERLVRENEELKRSRGQTSGLKRVSPEPPGPTDKKKGGLYE